MSEGRVYQSSSIAELAKALSAAQKEVRPPKKDKEAEITSKRTGKTFRYAYSDLADSIEAIRGPFGDHGLAVTQTFEVVGDRLYLVTTLMHESGEWKDSLYPLSQSGSPQEQGSEQTYVRRYSLNAIAGLASDDDDGAAASREPARKEQPQERKKAASPGEEKDRAEVAKLITQTVELTGQPEERVCRGASVYFPTGHDRAAKQPTYEERWGELFPPGGAKSCAAVGIMPSRLLPKVKAALLERQKRYESEQIDKGVQEVLG